MVVLAESRSLGYVMSMLVESTLAIVASLVNRGYPYCKGDARRRGGGEGSPLHSSFRGTMRWRQRVKKMRWGARYQPSRHSGGQD